MVSFAITLYGQCCRRHVVGQQFLSDTSVVRIVLEVCVACVLNPVIPICYDVCYCCTWNVYSASHNTKHSLTYDMAACAW